MKISKNKNEHEFFSEFLKTIPKKIKSFVRISTDIAAQINYYLAQKNLTQRDLAERLGKKESEISKWLSGNHNFTIKTIANIEEAVGEEIITVPLFAKKNYKFIPYNLNTETLDIDEVEKIEISPSNEQVEIDNNNPSFSFNIDINYNDTKIFH